MRLIIFTFLVFIPVLAFAENETRQVCINKTCVKAEVADTDYKRQEGLMFREALAQDQGMIFIFDREDRYSFWMKNMLIPLDFIWISKDKRVVDISKAVLPCSDSCDSLLPKEKVEFVLEVSSGFTDTHKIRIGDKVSF